MPLMANNIISPVYTAHISYQFTGDKALNISFIVYYFDRYAVWVTENVRDYKSTGHGTVYRCSFESSGAGRQ